MKLFIILDGLDRNGKGLVFKVVTSLANFVAGLPSWIGTDYKISHNQDGSDPIWFPIEQIEDYPPLKVFYMTFTSEEDKYVFRVERRNVH